MRDTKKNGQRQQGRNGQTCNNERMLHRRAEMIGIKIHGLCGREAACSAADCPHKYRPEISTAKATGRVNKTLPFHS